MGRNYIYILICGILGAMCILSGCSDLKREIADTDTCSADSRKNSEQKVEVNTNNSDGIVTVTSPDSLLVLVNKKRHLPKGYLPKNLVTPRISSAKQIMMRSDAARALEQLFAEADSDKVHLVGISGYRSCDTQRKIYTSSMAARGKDHTSRFVAFPGSSEHQTGLAIDVASKKQQDLTSSFEKTDEGRWLLENAARFGFIIRYPKGKEKITGYAYEPWHIRYVGKKAAKEIMERKLTLEEYLL